MEEMVYRRCEKLCWIYEPTERNCSEGWCERLHVGKTAIVGFIN